MVVKSGIRNWLIPIRTFYETSLQPSKKDKLQHYVILEEPENSRK